ncbi:hypothetical protein DFP72DRAFT_966588 [Ephemerocybe angulata]|uniref:Uncharacterized protein n=1 Tax=Ephemerocybe angulata TaxID=980116 RepID=A0A8H6M5D6_9AGAR|nr:hypothetical protein DFP72DRAFT_966588 [Tulosesus angulatus]
MAPTSNKKKPPSTKAKATPLPTPVGGPLSSTAPRRSQTTSKPTISNSVRTCSTLESDGRTQCTKVATLWQPNPERCNVHHGQYRLLCKRYKESEQEVERIRTGKGLPPDIQTGRYSREEIMHGLEIVNGYIKAIRVEAIGREIHSKRFGLKVGDAYQTRMNVLEVELGKARRVVAKLGERALALYLEHHPQVVGVGRSPESQKIWKDAQAHILPDPPQAASGLFIRERRRISLPPSVNSGQTTSEDEDLIEQALQWYNDIEKKRLQEVLKPVLDLNLLAGDDSDVAQRLGTVLKLDSDDPPSGYPSLATIRHYQAVQHARRIILHDSVFYAKSLDKNTFQEFILSNDFDFTDAARLRELTSRMAEFALPWIKDILVEALELSKRPHSGDEANDIGDAGSGIQILGGPVHNHAENKSVFDEVWWHLFTYLKPAADTDYRYVGLCTSHSDLVGMLSIGSLGLLHPPEFCRFDDEKLTTIVIDARKALSLLGVAVTDLVSPQALTIKNGGVLQTKTKPKTSGHVVWREAESRAYLFGAVQHENGGAGEAFLNELRARPELYQLLVYSETDPESKVEESGLDVDGKALPALRIRTFETAPSSSSISESEIERTSVSAWETVQKGSDLMFESEEGKGLGYVTRAKRREPNWFFSLKTFPVKYFVVLDAVPNRHGSTLLKHVAWAALRAGAYAEGEFNEVEYGRSLSRLGEAKAKELGTVDT